jgi:hypothetical protein
MTMLRRVCFGVFGVLFVAPALAWGSVAQCEDAAVRRANQCHDDCARAHGDPSKGNRGGGYQHALCKQACDQRLILDLAACNGAKKDPGACPK